MKVATETLRKGGWFITKVFRSRDYNALMYVANQLFTKVDSNKPQSSRNTSAEIFMVCQGYKAPDIIDPKLLDPKHALEQVEEETNTTNTDRITSLKKLLKQKVNRGGYEDGVNQLYAECDIMDFLQSSDPHEYLSGFNKFLINDAAREVVNGLKGPADLDEIVADLKVCGRREFSDLLKLRHAYNLQIERKQREVNAAKRALIPVKEKTQEELEAEVDKELDETIKRVEREKKRQLKKEREREAKQDMRKKMSVIAATAINNDEDLTLDKKTWDKLKQIDIDEAQAYMPDDSSSEEENLQELRYKFHTDGGDDKFAALDKKEGDDDDSDSISEDEAVTRVDRMAMEIDESMRAEKEYAMLIDKKEAKKSRKAKALVELQR